MISLCVKYCKLAFWLFFTTPPQLTKPAARQFLDIPRIEQILLATSNIWRVSERERERIGRKKEGHTRTPAHVKSTETSREQCCCTAFLVTDQFLCRLFLCWRWKADAQTAQFPVLQLQLQAKKNTYQTSRVSVSLCRWWIITGIGNKAPFIHCGSKQTHRICLGLLHLLSKGKKGKKTNTKNSASQVPSLLMAHSATHWTERTQCAIVTRRPRQHWRVLWFFLNRGTALLYSVVPNCKKVKPILYRHADGMLRFSFFQSCKTHDLSMSPITID